DSGGLFLRLVLGMSRPVRIPGLLAVSGLVAWFLLCLTVGIVLGRLTLPGPGPAPAPSVSVPATGRADV
ncbi:MAG: hypothetical protein ACQSGP_03000, partial [Frankia sp.]